MNKPILRNKNEDKENKKKKIKKIKQTKKTEDRIYGISAHITYTNSSTNNRQPINS